MSKFWGGGGCQKPTNQSQHMESQCSGGTKLQPPLSTAMFYCYNLNYNILTVYNKEHPPVGSCGNTAATLSLWPNMTTFYPDPEDAVKPWNCQVKLPGLSEAWNWKQNLWPNWPNKTCWLNGTELSSESALSEAESSTDESAGNFLFGLGF